MSRSPGCQPSPLIEAIFYRLPYFTSGLATNVSIENILDDFVVSCVTLLDYNIIWLLGHVVPIVNTASCWMGCYPPRHSDCAEYLHVFLLLLH